MSEGKLLHGRYKPMKKLHRTGLGEVFLVQDVTLDRPLLLETIQGPPQGEGGAKLPPEAARALKQDLEALLAIQDPHLLGVIDLQLGAKPPFMVFEPVPGETLVKWRSPNPLRGAALEEELDSVAHQVVEALGTLHGHGVIHKDLRPATVVRRENGEVVLLEPGVALSGEGLAALHPSFVTPLSLFLSPEVLRGEAATPASDLYQLGALLRFLVTGKPPYASPDEARAAARESRALPPLKQEAPGLRDAWCQLVDELMAPRVQDRIASVPAAREFLDLMLMEEAQQEGLLPAEPAAGPTLTPPEQARSRAWVLVPAVLVTLLAVGGAGWLLTAGASSGPTLKGEFRTGFAALEARWTATSQEAGGPPEDATLEVGGETRELSVDGDALVLRAPWGPLAGQVYRVVDGAGALLASGTFPEGARPFAAEVTPLHPEDGPLGAVDFLLELSHPASLTARWTTDAGPQEARAGGEPERSPQVRVVPPRDGAATGLTFVLRSPLGEEQTVEGPEELLGPDPFLLEASKRVRGLVPSDFVKKVLRPAVEKAKEQALTLEFPGWEEIRTTWREDPFFVRLRRLGPRLFAQEDADYGALANLYDAFLGVERANTVVVALSDLAPLEVREVYAPFCRAFDAAELRGALVVSSGQGPMMMQYANPPPSFINEDGGKRWPSSFEASYIIPAEQVVPGGTLRFTVAVEDISPLYRLELGLFFPEEGGGGGDDLFAMPAGESRRYWFYPRRNFFDVLEDRDAEKEDRLEAAHKMALEVPTAHLPRRNVKITLRADKLGIWGGHGATTLIGLFVGPGEPRLAPGG